jgi:outer membrane biosynthesis protein TonB
VNAVPEPEPEPPPLPEREVRHTSFARKAIAVLLPLLCALLLAEPLLKKPEQKTINQPNPSASAANAAAPSASALAKLTPPVASATPDTLAVLPRGMTAAHAAADSVATGDFSRALGLYRELARREPQNQAYREAARILGERPQTRSP